MDEFDKWLLPEGINEVLPEEAMRLENMRRLALGLFNSWGYDFVIPPLAEFLESFLLDDRDDLQVQTFKLTDQISGRMLGVRPDMTPQIARIDAHSLRKNNINRLCYIGKTLNARSVGVGRSRSPLQVGAEIYGHKGIESDIEIIRLMLGLFNTLAVDDIHLVLGHVGVYSTLAKAAGLTKQHRKFLSQLMRTKAKHDIKDYLSAIDVPQNYCEMFIALVDCYGDLSALALAEEQLGSVDPEISAAFEQIRKVAEELSNVKQLTIHCDVLEAPGYDYEDGLVFSAFTTGLGQEIARGGRYDGIGQVFGRARPAVGFSSDLELISRVSKLPDKTVTKCIYAPCDDDTELNDAIAKARKSGARVIVQLDKNDEPTSYGCTDIFVKEKGKWVVRGL